MMIGLDGLLNRFYFNQDFSVPEVVFTSGKWLLAFTYLGEGRSGDFDVNDPTDVPLYCTSIPVDTAHFLLERLANALFSKLEQEYPFGLDTSSPDECNCLSFNDRIMQRWTWETPHNAANGTMD